MKKNKDLENNEKFSVSNEIIPLKKPLDLGILKKKSSILSSKDFPYRSKNIQSCQEEKMEFSNERGQEIKVKTFKKFSYLDVFKRAIK